MSHDITNTSPLPPAPPGRKVISLYDHRAGMETKHSEQRAKEGNNAEFRICRRRVVAKAEHFHEWTGVDQCFRCNQDVIYDRRDSQGIPHICLACASSLATGNFLKGVTDDPVNEDLSSEEHWARIQASISQHKHGEHKR